jgi:DNA replication ATP-dependent helicase Dna2
MEKLEEVGLFGRWTDSLFERLWFLNDRNGWPAIVTLDTHFRMHEQIAQAIAAHYLPTQLRVGNDFQLEGWSCEDDWTNLSQHRRLVFVENRSSDRGKVNRSEAEDVARIAVQLIGRKQEQQEWTDFLGIITPWRAQIEEIKRAIFKLREETGIEVELEKVINIDTVERFQGSEADYILFSTCVNGENYLEALTSTEQNGVDRKLLVAISRARKQMIMLGKSDFLKLSTPYGQLLEYIEQNGARLVMD